MKMNRRLLPAASLLLSFAAHAAAQGAAGRDFEIVEETDGGLTHVELKAMPVEMPGRGGDPLELAAHFSYALRGREKVLFIPVVTLGFTSRGEAPSFNIPNFGDIVFVLDGRAMKISGRIEDIERGEGTVTSFAEPGVSWVDVLLPLKNFNRIVAAERVEVKIGSLTIRLRDKHLRALRELWKRIPPAKTARRAVFHDRGPDAPRRRHARRPASFTRLFTESRPRPASSPSP